MRKNLILLLLVLIFIMPGVFALLVYKHPSLIHATTNRGSFVLPEQKLSDLPVQGKWRLVLWQAQPCDNVCQINVEQLAKVRLALGRRLYQVEFAVLSPHENLNIPEALKQAFLENDIKWYEITPERQAQLPALEVGKPIFIVSPANDLVLSYSLPVSAAAIYADLKKLLMANEQREQNHHAA